MTSPKRGTTTGNERNRLCKSGISGIIRLALQKANGLDGLDNRRQSRADIMFRGFFHGLHEIAKFTDSFLVDRAGAPSGAIVPIAIPSIPHGLPPDLDGLGCRFQTCSIGAK